MPRVPSMEDFRERKARHRQRGRVYRVSFATAGFAIVALGVALIPLPGPGWVIVALGLAMLALEFDRAERLLEAVLVRLERVSDQAANATPLQKALIGLLVLAGAAAAVVAVLLWEIPLLPG